MKRAYLLIFICAICAFPMMAYESPITEPGAGSPTSMYRTAGSGPHRDPVNSGTGSEQTIDPQDWLDDGGGSGSDAGDWDKYNSPVGAPWVLLGFAAAYGASVAIKRRKE